MKSGKGRRLLLLKLSFKASKTIIANFHTTWFTFADVNLIFLIMTHTAGVGRLWKFQPIFVEKHLGLQQLPPHLPWWHKQPLDEKKKSCGKVDEKLMKSCLSSNFVHSLCTSVWCRNFYPGKTTDSLLQQIWRLPWVRPVVPLAQYSLPWMAMASQRQCLSQSIWERNWNQGLSLTLS